MSDYFPLELIVEILERLPLKSAVRCMCVCKAWKSIITNYSFVVSHRQRLPSNSPLFFHLRIYDESVDDVEELFSLYSDNDATDSLSVFKFPPVNTSSHVSWTVFGTCNGLVCFANNTFSDYTQVVIWNPSIFKYLILPKPSITFETPRYNVDYGFGFDSHNQDFKVVRFVSSCDTEFCSSHVEIYSLAAHSWRIMTDGPFPFRIDRILNKLFNGVLHWVAQSTINGVNRHFILTFDLFEEKFGELMLPSCLKEGARNAWDWSIFRGYNLLALQHNTRSSPENRLCSTSIWVMKEYGVVESWTQLFHFDWTRYNGDMQSVLTLRSNDEVVLRSSNKEITFLDPIKGLEKKIRHISSYMPFVGDHVECLFLINEKKAKSYLPQTLSIHLPRSPQPHGLRFQFD